MQILLRILMWVANLFLVLWLLLVSGLAFGGAFVAKFTIENRSDEVVVVTPVGTVGSKGVRSPLPVQWLAFPALPAMKSGGFRLAPSQSVTIKYDMDDINFSEIVVETESGPARQLVTDPTPLLNQYHGPDQDHYVIDDVARLELATPSVRTAAGAADGRSTFAWFVYSLLIGPWI